MPNWCENEWDFSGPAHDLHGLLTTEKQLVTFDKLIPMRAILKSTGVGERVIDGHHVDIWFYDPTSVNGLAVAARLPTPQERAELDRIGFTNWYDWNLANWGCKWNASGSVLSDHAVRKRDKPS